MLAVIIMAAKGRPGEGEQYVGAASTTQPGTSQQAHFGKVRLIHMLPTCLSPLAVTFQDPGV